jgi:2-polyprenyl-3-methyl-5-hydroxy-6-metoxy-1,4-benzoquinol methylase
MTIGDRLLQAWRIARAQRYIPHGASVLDIGCADGTLFKVLGSQLKYGIGIDPVLSKVVETERYRLISGIFPEDLGESESVDVITLLAVLEHIPPSSQPEFAQQCAGCLKQHGLLIVTVPSPVVDQIVSCLQRVQILDGMSLGEHYGYDPAATPKLFLSNGFSLVKSEKFQLGFNNLYVFQRN